MGIPEWAQTAVVYVRGFLVHQHGVDLASVEWHQAGVSSPGRVEKVAITLPDGVRVVRHPDRTLEELLFAGEVDALVTAQPPQAFVAGDPRIRRLFAEPRAAEEAYFAATGVFPIMHTVAIRRDVLDAHPWVARNLLAAFERAKRASYDRLADAMAPRLPLPWAADDFARARSVFGSDVYPYGVEPNRTTLEAVVGFAHEQGVTARRADRRGAVRPDDAQGPCALVSERVAMGGRKMSGMVDGNKFCWHTPPTHGTFRASVRVAASVIGQPCGSEED